VHLVGYFHKHRRNLANNNGGTGGGDQPWVLETLIYAAVKLQRQGRFVLTRGLHFNAFRRPK